MPSSTHIDTAHENPWALKEAVGFRPSSLPQSDGHRAAAAVRHLAAQPAMTKRIEIEANEQGAAAGRAQIRYRVRVITCTALAAFQMRRFRHVRKSLTSGRGAPGATACLWVCEKRGILTSRARK